MELRRYITIVAMVAVALFSRAQSAAEPDSRPLITSHIAEGGNVIVEMPDALLERIRYVAEKEKEEDVKPATGKMGGYRIQVFSDNNARTAKSEARTRARNISAQFPQYPTYVVYSSPYWRLRVGNFRTQEEANQAAHELKEAFPRYSREIRVVRDRVVITE